MEALITFAIITITSTKLTSGTLCQAEKCAYDIKPTDQYSQFDMHGEPLETRTRLITIEKSNSTGCYINTTDVVESFSFTEVPLVAILLLLCRQNNRVYFTPFDQPKHNNAIGYLQVGEFNLSYENIAQFSRVMDVRVIELFNNQLYKVCNDMPTECRGLRTYNSQYPPPKFKNINPCNEVFPELGEVTFGNMSWSEIPNFLQERLIHLQALEVPYSNFTLPPYFPWTKKERNLPRNLSRTRYSQNHYSEAFGLDIAANIFRRYFNLDYNQISDLRNFSFNGHLHMLSIKSNHLAHVGVQTFRNVSGLQHLDLSQNELKQIPMGIFDGLVTLRYLKLQENKIQELATGIFDDLQSLTSLKIANNYISLLQKGLFTRLGELHVLHLEYNNISVIENDAFPVDSIVLKYVYLNNNPLLSMPEFIFWIRSLHLVDLISTLISFRTFGDFLDSIDIFSLIIDSASSSNTDVDKKEEKFIDMTNAKVENIYVQNMTLLRQKKLILMIQNYHFKLDGNPLSCSCNIIPFHRFIYELLKNKTLKGDEYYFTEWKCESPVELRGRRMLDVKPVETYCPINVSGCPKECSCYKRFVNMNIIVDCRWRNLSDLHDVLPQSDLELWYNDTTNKHEGIDAVIVHSGKLTDWVMDHIVDILEGENYNFHVCDMARDFVIGFTFQENLNQVVRHSKRMILLISEDWRTDDETFNVAWNIAQEKIKESKSNFGIIISHGVTSKQIKDKALLRFMQRGRYIDSKHKLFVEKILYSMPIKDEHVQERKPNISSLIQRKFSIHEGEVDDNRIHTFVSYSDQDQEFVTSELVPDLEKIGYRLCIPDRDFIPGASKKENILKAIDGSLRTLFILSVSHIKDEWSLFTFITACEKSLRVKTNYLIVIVREDIDLPIMDKEVNHYLKTHISLHVKDRWLWSKLLNGLPPSSRRYENPRNSPLVKSRYSAPDDVATEIKEVLTSN
ncbi:hypothetical protein CHS0354_007209 [Potamilus streckersoni]|uniref:TIR domain-containing protein n=1 Tax=Potamilus streckersoni TaxID=2493646 RepID=A0AAE0WEP4_9BIVA|nr:hypothetical protein CHS0354_007209 [Potamilus streckersoni]